MSDKKKFKLGIDPEKVKKRRRELGMSQEQAAKRAGMRQEQWSHYETGTTLNPRMQTLYALLFTLKCNITDLLPDCYIEFLEERIKLGDELRQLVKMANTKGR